MNQEEQYGYNLIKTKHFIAAIGQNCLSPDLMLDNEYANYIRDRNMILCRNILTLNNNDWQFVYGIVVNQRIVNIFTTDGTADDKVIIRIFNACIEDPEYGLKLSLDGVRLDQLMEIKKLVKSIKIKCIGEDYD